LGCSLRCRICCALRPGLCGRLCSGLCRFGCCSSGSATKCAAKNSPTKTTKQTGLQAFADVSGFDCCTKARSNCACDEWTKPTKKACASRTRPKKAKDER
jgi:hypothetical protein